LYSVSINVPNCRVNPLSTKSSCSADRTSDTHSATCDRHAQCHLCQSCTVPPVPDMHSVTCASRYTQTIHFYTLLLDLQNSVAFWKVPRLRPFVLVRASCRGRWLWSTAGMILTGGTEVLGEKHYTAWVVDGWMSMEQWWNGTDRGN